MFNYRNTTVAFILVLLLCPLFGFLFHGWFLVPCFLFLVIAWFIILTLGSVFIRWNFYFFSHSHGDRSSPEIAITFDDGPNEKITPEILSILEKHNIRAAFFCIGEKIEKYPDIFKNIAEKGHIIGNHSYSHSFWFDFYSSQRMEDEIMKTDEIIMKLTGKTPKLFRPPYGVTNPMLRKALKKTGHHSVSWSLRSNDTVKKPDRVLISINKKLKNGDIVLFHDTISSTPAMVEQFIINAKNRGKAFVGLDELLKFKRYDNPTVKYL
jgi:peptidoglycan/xylan/chitin deacetylase (PgdA/CDA1 family)